MSELFFWALQLLLIPLLSPLCIGITRKVKAVFQNRRGASPFQPYRDLWKLFHKDEVISEDASWIFRAAPYLIFATTLVIGASIPLVATVAPLSLMGDFLVFVYLIALGTFFLALSGIDGGGGLGGFGASREMMVASLTEGGLILSLATLALATHSSNLFSISESVSTLTLANSAPIFLACVSFIISLLAETARYPFDNPATHLELTMIHEAMILEHSGKRLALMEWAAANKYLIFIVLGANLFFPWGIAQTHELPAIFLALAVLAAKVIIGCAGIAVLESSIAKLRIFRLPDLLFASMILSMIAIGLLF